ncbi:MAG: hypothetical protein QE263_04815 [Vampirovibrionales bacterium]|nr:hypothetical protein [Vampirovibrionales bacterium]
MNDAIQRHWRKALFGQSAPEFALVAALIVLAAGSSIGPVKEAIEKQSIASAKTISVDAFETTGSECLVVGGTNNGSNGEHCSINSLSSSGTNQNNSD